MVGGAVAVCGVFALLVTLTSAAPVREGGELEWQRDYAVALEQARTRGVPLMIDFTAQWCAACHELESEVFYDQAVSPRLRREVVALKVDFDRAMEGEGEELLRRYEVTGLPRVAFATATGELLKGPSFEGKVSVETFLGKLDALGREPVGGESEFSRTWRTKGLWATLGLVFVAGFLSSLTPCVYPLIPITIGVFGARGARTRWEGFGLSAVYVLGIALTYSGLGVSAAWFGSVFGGAMQHPAMMWGLGALFVALGLGSLGVYQVRLPGDLQTRLSQMGGAGWLGSFLMGLVAGVIAAPCVGPIVAGILVVVAKEQSVWLGGGMLFVFALGMGVLFLALGTFSSLLDRLPRSGRWMEGVKTMFGVVFFALALYYIRYAWSPLGQAVAGVWEAVGARF